MENTESLQLKNQICFPLYALSKEITKLYRPLLEQLDMTYPQYLVMMVLWEKDGLTVSELGEKLLLDSGTLTPLLKRLETKSYLSRKRKKEDERVVELFLTKEGINLQQKACPIPSEMLEKMDVKTEDLTQLKTLLDTILEKIQQ
ncbi:MAG: MarR family winged helix-turn-helix transcriptional regulator [Flavobacterium sp.]